MNNNHPNLGKEYLEHKVFETLKNLSSFYELFSFGIMGFVTSGVPLSANIDTYVFSSMKGTLESIHDILFKGRINDAYALMRKYNDSLLINIYCNLYLEDNLDIDNFIVEKITNWIKGTEQMPTNRVINTYIEKSAKVSAIHALMMKDNTYALIKERCNDHTHYNFYKNVLLNDNEIYSNERIKELDQINADIQNLVIFHLGYLLYFKAHYMTSSDYVDHLEMGLEPPKDSQYWVAPYIQEIFDNIIKPMRQDIALEIIDKTYMHLL